MGDLTIIMMRKTKGQFKDTNTDKAANEMRQRSYAKGPPNP